jgi:hypothetical protein
VALTRIVPVLFPPTNDSNRCNIILSIIHHGRNRTLVTRHPEHQRSVGFLPLPLTISRAIMYLTQLLITIYRYENTLKRNLEFLQEKLVSNGAFHCLPSFYSGRYHLCPSSNASWMLVKKFCCVDIQPTTRRKKGRLR